jgi:hypothetical protein
MHIINLEDGITSASLEHFNEETAFHWLGNFWHFLLTDLLFVPHMNLSQNVFKSGGFIMTKYTSKGILYSTEESYAVKGSLNSNCN